MGFEDRRQSPAFVVGLEAIGARVAGVDTGSATPTQVEVDAKVASGGEIKAKGSVRADNGTSDLQISVAGVALAPVQSYLADVAELRLASGAVSTEGRLRYGDADGARLAYEGRVAVDRLLLEEFASKRPFLAWDAVASDDVVLTLQPNRLDIGELRIERPAARLIIAEDQTVNLMDVLKKPKTREGASGASGEQEKTAKPAPDESSDTGDDPFPVTVARVRVSDGALEFADLSLRPQFGTRMHELNGVISGLGTDASRSATAAARRAGRQVRFGEDPRPDQRAPTRAVDRNRHGVPQPGDDLAVALRREVRRLPHRRPDGWRWTCSTRSRTAS